MSANTYFYGLPITRPTPLARFLPPLPQGVVENWLHANIPNRSAGQAQPWILDPFGSTPRIAVEAARAGYRVLIAANNPIARFLLEMEASPPTEESLRAALAKLAAARRGDERLELHLRSLYLTQCDHCGTDVEASAYIWERGDEDFKEKEEGASGPRPIARIYHCPNCDTGGEFPANDADIARAATYTSSGLHYARALERVAALHDPDRRHVEEAIAVYLPRAVYAVFTLINKIDSLPLDSEMRNQIIALLLSVCDQANTLWPYPSGRARPRALTIPPKFREYNVWIALEDAISQWATTQAGIPMTIWPDLPPNSGGICIYEGRLRELVTNLSGSPIDAVVTAFPRPNQAYWTLSALWAGWLWGTDALGPFKSVLRRRRYDWAWHTTALYAVLEYLSPVLEKGTPLFGLVGEVEPGYLSAVMISNGRIGFDFIGLAMPAAGGHAQISWRQSTLGNPPHNLVRDEVPHARLAALQYLRERGEPSTYLNLHAAILQSLCGDNAWVNSERSPAEDLSQFNDIIEEALTYRGGFLRYGGSDKALDVGLWWLREIDDCSPPLPDRVEEELTGYLISQPDHPLSDLYAAISAAFPGLLTPSAELIQTCLGSYGEEFPPQSGHWRLSAQNTEAARQKDLNNIRSLLREIAGLLGYQVEGETPVIWRDKTGRLAYAWYVITSAVVSDIIFNREYSSDRSLIVFPGGRANLVAYKIQNDPRLRQAIEEGWRMVKFRQVRWLAQNPVISLETFDHLLTQDSLTFESPQMRFF